MKNHVKIVVLAVSLTMLCSPQAFAKKLTANQIVKKVDNIRFPQTDFSSQVKITSNNPKKKKQVSKYRLLYQKGAENSLVITTAPAEDKGQIMLMKGNDLWVFIPQVSQPIRLSLSQRLTGIIANGDLARTNFSEDYKAKILKSDRIKGKKYFVLDLTASSSSTTYRKIKLWVEKSTYRPHKAEYYSISKKLLKTCKFSNFKKVLGKKRPIRLTMIDAVKNGYSSVLEYSSWQNESIPDKTFTKQYLKKIDPMSLTL